MMEVTNHTTKDKCILNFKPAGWFGKDLYWVDGCVLDAEKKRRYIVQGKWPYELWSYPTNGEMSGNSSDTGTCYVMYLYEYLISRIVILLLFEIIRYSQCYIFLL